MRGQATGDLVFPAKTRPVLGQVSSERFLLAVQSVKSLLAQMEREGFGDEEGVAARAARAGLEAARLVDGYLRGKEACLTAVGIMQLVSTCCSAGADSVNHDVVKRIRRRF